MANNSNSLRIEGEEERENDGKQQTEAWEILLVRPPRARTHFLAWCSIVADHSLFFALFI
jgi:hypothetical protein